MEYLGLLLLIALSLVAFFAIGIREKALSRVNVAVETAKPKPALLVQVDKIQVEKRRKAEKEKTEILNDLLSLGLSASADTELEETMFNFAILMSRVEAVKEECPEALEPVSELHLD